MSETGILFLALEGVFRWNKARIKCFSMIVMAMISAQSVNLADVADHAKPDNRTKYESLYKRIQRFFVEFKLPFDDIGQFVFNLFKFTACNLIIDRTNWWFGDKHIS